MSSFGVPPICQNNPESPICDIYAGAGAGVYSYDPIQYVHIGEQPPRDNPPLTQDESTPIQLQVTSPLTVLSNVRSNTEKPINIISPNAVMTANANNLINLIKANPLPSVAIGLFIGFLFLKD